MLLPRLLKNWPYKLLALGTAIILVTYVHGEINPQTSVSVESSILAMHRPSAHTLKLSPDKLSLVIQGPKTEVAAVVDIIKSGEVRPTVDLEDLDDGVHSLPVKIDMPDTLAPNVTIQPLVRSITASIEANTTRTLSVMVRMKNTPPIGYATGSTSVEPNSATIRGASSLVNSVARLVVIADPTTMRPIVDEDIAIRALDYRGNEVRGVAIEPLTAHVVAKLVEAPAEKAVFVQPNVTGQPQYPFKVDRISVTPWSVIVKGKPEMLAGITVLTTDEVDVSDVTQDVVRRVGLHVPPGVQIAGDTNVRVAVKIVTGANP